jgi:hypothetical protein
LSRPAAVFVAGLGAVTAAARALAAFSEGPTEGAMALAREEQEAQASKQAARQAALEAVQRKARLVASGVAEPRSCVVALLAPGPLAVSAPGPSSTGIGLRLSQM